MTYKKEKRKRQKESSHKLQCYSKVCWYVPCICLNSGDDVCPVLTWHILPV